MKLLFVVLLVAPVLVFGQVAQDQKFFVPLVLNETDTVPGTQTGGAGNGGAGWLYVGDLDVVYSVTSVDSTHFTVVIDYADTGYSASSGRSAYSVGYKSYTVTTVTDSIANFADEAAPMNFTSRVVRHKGYVDNIPGGQWIRFRLFGVNVADKFAATAAGRTVRLDVRTLRYAGN